MENSFLKQFDLLSAQLVDERVNHRSRARDLAERIVAASLLGDFLVAISSLIFSFWIRFGPPLGEIGVFQPVHILQYGGYFVFGSVLLIAINAYREVYKTEALLRFRMTAHNLVQAIGLWFFGFLGLIQLTRYELPISRLYVLISTAVLIVGIIGWRFLLNRLLHRPVIANALSQKVVLIGWNANAARLVEGFARTHTRVYHVAGCLATGPMEPDGSVPEPHIPILGGSEDLQEIIHRHDVSVVIVSDPNLSSREVSNIAKLCERELVQFKIAPSYFQILVSGLHLQSFNNIPVLGISRLPLDNFFNVATKRIIDLAGATFGLLISLPLMLVFGTIVYLESPGPIFYRQKRVGRNGRVFNILKIRSMRLDAEKNSQPGWSTKNDPRRLKIGGFIRKWNIDEVPQFWNVLKGEMSLVGPRPERPELIMNFKDEIPHYQARHNVKPGITGWAQVKGLRGDTDLGERIKCDIFYLENWNLILDLQIMLMTFVGNKNAA